MYIHTYINISYSYSIFAFGCHRRVTLRLQHYHHHHHHYNRRGRRHHHRYCRRRCGACSVRCAARLSASQPVNVDATRRCSTLRCSAPLVFEHFAYLILVANTIRNYSIASSIAVRIPRNSVKKIYISSTISRLPIHNLFDCFEFEFEFYMQP